MGKNIYFFSIHLFNEATKREESYTKIKELLKEIIIKHNKNNAMILHEGDDLNRNQVTMDIISNTGEYLFGKIGKIKDNSTFQFREYSSLNSSEVLSQDDIFKKGLEIYTYYFIDYNTGILSIIRGQSAPSEQCLNQLVDRYNCNYYTRIAPIADPESVKALFKPGSVLNSISYTVAVPSSEVLGDKQIVGLNRQQIEELKGSSLKRIDITLKNDDRKFLSNVGENIKAIINSFSTAKSNYKNIKFNGKIENGISKDYFFDECTFKSNIDIKNYRIEDGKKVMLEKTELDNQYFLKLRGQFLENRAQLLALSDRCT